MLLVVDKLQSNADTVSDIFNVMRIISYGTTPEHAAFEISNRHRAVLFVYPERINAIEELVELAKTYSLDTSVFAISAKQNPKLDYGNKLYTIFDAVFPSDSLSSKIVYDFIAYQTKTGKTPLGSYRLAGLDASINVADSTYFDTPINLTKTETMIVRFLIASHPVSRSAREIIKNAFRAGKMPELSNVRTHITSINKKFMKLANRRIISSVVGKGYHIVIS